MAEHMGRKAAPGLSGMNMMGKPVLPLARQAGYDACKAMGITEEGRRWSCVNAVADRLERDKPYEAQAEAMLYLDLTGAYRLMATLLVASAKLQQSGHVE